MVQATIDEIGDALDFEITDWRETQRDAIQNVTFPALPNQPDIFKTATMFNFGVKATSAMYPNSAADTIIKSASAHLFILGAAQDAFTNQYRAAVARSQTQLTSRFTQLSDSFIRKIQDMCRTFKNSTEGREMARAIFQATQGIEFIDDAQRDALLRQLIRDANLVETDPTVIRTLTDQGFGRLTVKIRNLWRASYHDAWAPDANMWYSGSFQVFASAHRTGQQWTHIRNHADQDWMIRNAWRLDVSYYEEPNFFSHNRDDCRATLLPSRVNITDTFDGVEVNQGTLNAAVATMRNSIQSQARR